MKTTVEVIGPKEAAKYLERNQNNRPMRSRTVARYASMMSRGQWMLTHEAIAFDTTGELTDGQHRLAAIVESGASAQFTVTRGVEPATYEVIDSGVRRSLGDRLQQREAPYYAVASAGLRYYLLYGLNRDLRWTATGTLVSDKDVLALYERLGAELVSEAGAAAMAASAPEVRITRTSAFAAYLLFKEADPTGQVLPAFWDGLVTGVDLKKNDPRLALRRWAANAGTMTWSKGQRTIVGLIKAWNAYVKGAPLASIRWLPNEAMPEVVPVGTTAKAAVAR